jgi:hypothetical protein
VELGQLLLATLWFLLVCAALTAVNAGLAALAFRVNVGAGPWPLDPGDFRWRCILAGGLLTAYLAVAYLGAFVLVGRDAAGVFWLLLIPYPFAAVYGFCWAFAMDDWLDGVRVFLLHHLVPVLLLLLLALFVAPLRDGLNGFNPWHG